jgi:hypothetical protein
MHIQVNRIHHLYDNMYECIMLIILYHEKKSRDLLT